MSTRAGTELAWGGFMGLELMSREEGIAMGDFMVLWFLGLFLIEFWLSFSNESSSELGGSGSHSLNGTTDNSNYGGMNVMS